jgi:hypothetical protein
MSQKMSHFYRILVEDSRHRQKLYENLSSRAAKEIETVYNKSRHNPLSLNAGQGDKIGRIFAS